MRYYFSRSPSQKKKKIENLILVFAVFVRVTRSRVNYNYFVPHRSGAISIWPPPMGYQTNLLSP